MLDSRTLAAPAFGFLGTMVAAGVVAWVGWRWAQHEDTRRTPPEPRLLQEFSQALQEELRRLERVYEDDLADLERAVTDDPKDGMAMAALSGRELKGLRQLSLLSPGKGSPPVHLSADGRMLSQWPQPVLLPAGERPPNAHSLPLPLEDIFPAGRRFDDTGRSGWSATTDRSWLVHWRVIQPQRVMVELIDRAEVVAATDAHLRTWAATAFGPLQSTKAAVGVVKADDTRVFGSFPDQTDRAPEFTQSLANELDAWRLVGWDRIEQRSWRDPARLAGAWSAAGLLLLGGIMGFRQQRHALRVAEERVTFVNRVSHELRTPVTNMLLNLDLARDHLGPSLNGAGARLDVVAEEAQRLGRLVANVLTFSRRDRGAPDLRSVPCLPDEVIESVLGQFAPALDRRGVEVVHSAEASQHVLLEADALAQILANLISNVEKYAAAGGLLRVESRFADGHLTVAVEDRGPGIPAGARERIFQPFERLSDRVNEGATGTGLGLCIARDLAERLGGSLRLVGTPVGARFELHLPTVLAELRT